MIRLIAPLLVLTLLFWGILYAIPKRTRSQSLSIARQIAVALAIAAGVLLLVSAIFFLGSLVNVN